MLITTTNAIEAAEQCGILGVPEVMEPAKLSKVIADWDERRLLNFADEAAPHASPLASSASISIMRRSAPMAAC